MSIKEAVEAPQPKRVIEYLTCCCCGCLTKGRQWWNRDTGYGLCNGCIHMNGVSRVKVGEEASSFGVRGTHWDVESGN